MKYLLALILSVALNASAAFLAPTNPPPTVSLAWDLAPGMTYNLYYGVASGGYTNRTSLGATNAATVVLPTRGVTYYFAATAVDTNGLESVFSTEVSYTPKAPPAAPGNMRPPLVLIVQWKSAPTDVWADAGMNWAFSPDATNRLYRLLLANK